MEKKNQGIQSVEQAFDIIDFFADQKQAISLSDAAEQLEMSKSKLHKYLASLLRVGVVVQDESGNYLHGSKLLELGAKILGRTDIVQTCEPFLHALRQSSQQAAALAVWTTQGPMIVRFLDHPSPVSVNFKIGFYAPVTSSAVGRCFAANLPTSAYESLAKKELNDGSQQWHAFTESCEQIKADFVSVREEVNPVIPGAKAVAAPIFDAVGEMTASIILIGFDSAQPIEQTHLDLISSAAQDISKQLGYLTD
ncbi:putative Transcriptional regulator, IclR family [Vibrio nigripulchritudo SFn27]|uniref:Putative Transcriptional regulator, IclR family n=1 Tax=Vibrio nigripulchritudo TaxID=28173 RepID=U4KA01_9VIBR|nr:IclR family transcriptional regulator [Vibrio nigripulchritudo]CCN83496.1 putative Transcriptional regulator, IclR family [Vibrio nigripulchritudo BLFn1]CCN90966.1 putative Transcriptional regulator, IclR family [Vibrio nigripulchritudo SFn27]CCN95191.1 putative Transcriptional regulator, IclR family [Vibrio nigripulchritudo ENn2]CCO42311.1 putative Transcriptional regulator, IclR family [Vibrio nigripulchritudo SFn135]CCO52206.1 putative Transcriptional regulator, IclR family [Vibrio nigri